jgi:hypothetical protein
MLSNDIPQLSGPKIVFLDKVLAAAEKRRDAVETKASILIAADAILLAALGSFGAPLIEPAPQVPQPPLLLVLFLVTAISIGISILFALNVLAALLARRRRKALKIPSDEFNVFWVGAIAEHPDADAYASTLHSITESEITAQLVHQAFNLSRLVMYRYKLFFWAQFFTVLSLVALLLFVIVWCLPLIMS